MELLAKRESVRGTIGPGERLLQLLLVLSGWAAMALLALCDDDGGVCAN